MHHYHRCTEQGTGRGVRLESGAHQRSDLDRVDQRGESHATWPSWARRNDELGHYTFGVEDELVLLEPRAGPLAQSSDEALVRLSEELSAHTFPETHGAVIELATGIHPDLGGVGRPADRPGETSSDSGAGDTRFTTGRLPGPCGQARLRWCAERCPAPRSDKRGRAAARPRRPQRASRPPGHEPGWPIPRGGLAHCNRWEKREQV